MPRKKSSPVSSPTRNTSISTCPTGQFPKPVLKYWESLDWGVLADSFGNTTLQRGRDYATSGRVRSLWVMEDGKHLLAIVVGSQEYTTEVSLEAHPQDDHFTISSYCSCPVGCDCKHGVATIVQFLTRIANDEPIPIGNKLDEETWEIVSENGKTTTITISDDDRDDDDDDWEDDDEAEEDEVPVPRRRLTAKKEDFESSLKENLERKSSKELLDVILQLYRSYDSVRQHFQHEAFAESVAKSGDVAKLVEKVIKLIDKTIGTSSFDHYDDYGGGAHLDFAPVCKLIKQIGAFGDALVAIDRVARHLMKRANSYVEGSGVEDTSDIDDVFTTMAETLLASKVPPVQIILWAYEIDSIDEYDLTRVAVETIVKRDWSVKIWSHVADAMLQQRIDSGADNGGDHEIRIIVNALDKSNRSEEATSWLRTAVKSEAEYEILADRLIEFGFLAEAETIAWKQREGELAQEKKRHGVYHGNSWASRLKTIAENKEDWPMLASIAAADFFDHPCRETIRLLLQTAKKLMIDSAVRRSLEKYLQSGELPAAVQKGLAGKKPTAKEQNDWPIPFFEFPLETKKAMPRFDVLCRWAIDENRPDDVVRWFDELSQQKQTPHSYGVNSEEVADAIADSHSDRAFRIYRMLAEHEMEVARNYPSAMRLLRKVRHALTAAGRDAEWPQLMAEIRTTHRRKPSLMKHLNELESGPIVAQKRHAH